MDIERGTVSTFLIPAREMETHYLCVFHSKEDRSNYQYCIATNEGNASGPLMIGISETDNAEALDSEVTLGAGDWDLTVYGQNSSTNLDPEATTRFVHSEMVSVVSDSDDAPVYPPNPCAGECDPVTVKADRIDTADATISNVASGSTFVIKLTDVKDNDGDTIEQVEYDHTTPAYILRQVLLKYTDASGTLQDFVTAGITGIDLTKYTLQSTANIPRITIYESDGVTVREYVDVQSPTYTLPEAEQGITRRRLIALGA